jgi:hypothetical protein
MKTPDFASMQALHDYLYRVVEDSAGTVHSRSFVAIRQIGKKDKTGKPGHWRPMQAGAAYFHDRFDSTLESQVPMGSRPNAVLIQSPALNRVFIGYEAQGVQYLTPVRLSDKADTSCVKWPEKGALTAKQVFAQLSKCYAPRVDSLCAYKGHW